jgi:hypothetical protein
MAAARPGTRPAVARLAHRRDVARVARPGAHPKALIPGQVHRARHTFIFAVVDHSLADPQWLIAQWLIAQWLIAQWLIAQWLIAR